MQKTVIKPEIYLRLSGEEKHKKGKLSILIAAKRREREKQGRPLQSLSDNQKETKRFT